MVNHLVAVHLYDVLTGAPFLRGAQQRVGTFAVWDGKTLRVPSRVSRRLIGHVVEVGDVAEDVRPVDLYSYIDGANNDKKFKELITRGVSSENDVAGTRRMQQLLRGFLVQPDTPVFEKLYNTRFVFLYKKGIPVVPELPVVVNNGIGTLTMYRTVEGGWIPHRLLVHSRMTRPVEDGTAPALMWTLAKQLFPCPLEYFQSIKMVADGSAFALRCPSVLWPSHRPGMRA